MSLSLLKEHFTKSKENFVKEPFYYFFCRQAASDKSMLHLAKLCPNPRTASYHLLASIQYLYNKRNLPISDFYEKEFAEEKYSIIYNKLKKFCIKEKKPLSSLLSNTDVTTNECARSAYLLAGLFRVNRIFKLRKVDIIELGSSIGLNLLFQEFNFLFCDASFQTLTWGNKNSSLKITTRVYRGFFDRIKPFPIGKDQLFGKILGVDKILGDISKKDQIEWQKALIWPSQNCRRERLEIASGIYKRRRPDIIHADIEYFLKKIETYCPGKNTILFFTSFVFNHIGSKKTQVTELLMKLSKSRRVINIIVDLTEDGKSNISIHVFKSGKAIHKEILGICDPHGGYINKSDNDKNSYS